MWAAYKGRMEVTKLLLEHGANANTTGQVTYTNTHHRTGNTHTHLSEIICPCLCPSSTVCIPSSGLQVVDTLKSSNFSYKTEPKSTVLIR